MFDVLLERERQVALEGMTEAHDDAHVQGELAGAAACYLLNTLDVAEPFVPCSAQVYAAELWPWARGWWKPKDRRRDLVRAAALAIAEVERLDRMEAGDAE
ncbi:hypothetical protein [Roseivivax marinus]|nr:hypothetical protein [Roseivivax marinus]